MPANNPKGMPSNLTPGNPGNRGGGRDSIKVRETKQAWLDSIFAAKQGADTEEVGTLIKKRLIDDALDPKFAGVRTWLSEMQYGKPQSKVEMVIGKPELLHALVHALHEAGVTSDQATKVIEGMRDFITGNPE